MNGYANLSERAKIKNRLPPASVVCLGHFFPLAAFQLSKAGKIDCLCANLSDELCFFLSLTRPNAPRHQEKKEDPPPPPPTKRLRFRNYLPDSADLQQFFLPTITNDEKNEEDPYVLELARLVKLQEDEEEGIVATKDPTWDLKRDLDPKLAILSRRTQRAIVDLIRQRLAAGER